MSARSLSISLISICLSSFRCACTFQKVHWTGFRLELGFSNLFPDLLIDVKVCDDIKSEHLIAYIFSATWSQYRWHGLSQSFKNERMYIFYALLHNLIVDTILTCLLKCNFLKFKKNYVVQSEPFRHSWVQFKAATAARNSIDPCQVDREDDVLTTFFAFRKLGFATFHCFLLFT